MQITQIYYEKVFPIAPYVNEKIGATISVLPGESSQQALEVVKEAVNNWGHKMVEEHRPPDAPQWLVTAPGPYSKQMERDTKADTEFEELKQQLDGFPTEKDATLYLLNTPFKFSVEAKNYIKQKFSQ